MSDFNLHQIVAPDLTSSEYGENIRKQFENINDNFKKLSNRDFIKGEKGDSIDLRSIDLYWPKNKIWIPFIKKAILENHDGKGTNPITKMDGNIIGWNDNFIINPGNLILIYKEDKIISSLPYIYLDPRFGKDLMKYAEINDYSELIDYTSVVYFDKYDGDTPVFKAINQFPTLYYDEELQQFCWKIWNSETGLIANGPAGKSVGSGNISYKLSYPTDDVVTIN